MGDPVALDADRRVVEQHLLRRQLAEESGDVAAANTIVRIIAARIRQLGLDKMNSDNFSSTSVVMPSKAT